MEIWGLKLINVIHQEVIRKITVDMNMQLEPIRIHQRHRRAQDASHRKNANPSSSPDFLQGLLELALRQLETQSSPFPRGTEPIDRQQHKTYQEPALHTHPDQHCPRHYPQPQTRLPSRHT